nr:putative ORF1 [Marmot picobirnavirus]
MLVTRNQIAFQEHKENVRYHQVMERLEQGKLDETTRANQAKERENYRSNREREIEANRSNMANEYEAVRSHQANESITSLNNMRNDITQNRNITTLANHYAAIDTGAGLLNLAKTSLTEAQAKLANEQSNYYSVLSATKPVETKAQKETSSASVLKTLVDVAKDVPTIIKLFAH